MKRVSEESLQIIDEARPRGRPWLNRNVAGMGAVSLLTDIASEMVMPLLPYFLTSTLGAGALALGWIEGVADSLSSLLQLLSGRLADKQRKNRPLVIAGYAISHAVKPLIALATAGWHVLAVRSADRIGKGIRTAPRDALLAASAAPEHRGSVYGFHRAMDHLGAVLGPLAAVLLLTHVTTDLRTIFWISAIPGLLAVATLVVVVRDVDAVAIPLPAAPRRLTGVTPEERTRLRKFLVPIGIFTLGAASDTFLLLKLGTTTTSLTTLPLLWMALHAVKSLASFLGGRMADRFGPRRVVIAGWIYYAAIYFLFGAINDPKWLAGLLIIYGLYHGMTEGPEKAYLTRLVHASRRATAFGWYHLVVGIMVLPASALFGYLWDTFGNKTAFHWGAGCAVAGAITMVLWAPDDRLRGDRPSQA